MPKNRPEEEEDDLDSALLAVTTKRKKSDEEEEEGELVDEKYEDSKPLKKRKSAKTETVLSSDSEEFDDGFDDDLMGDEEDRKYLSSLPELKKEEILTERYNKRKAMTDRLAIKKKLKREKQFSPSSKREARAKGTDKLTQAKQRAMNDLKKKREKRRVAESDEDEEEEYISEYSDEDEEFVAHHKRLEHKNKEVERSTAATTTEPAEDNDSKPVNNKTLEIITLQRSFLEKNVDEPWFNDIIAGFFVRVGIGKNDEKPVYRVAQIVEVKENPAKKYTLGKKVTNKFLLLRHGINQKQFSMEQVSNQPISESEFRGWVAEMDKNHLDVITRYEAKEKEKLLQLAQAYIVTEEDINKMVEQNRQLNKARLNPASEKIILGTQRDVAKDEGDMEEYERCVKKLEEIETLLSKNTIMEKEDKTLLWVSKINQRNKLVNTNTKYDVEKVVSDEVHDPFSRRQTKPSPTFVKPKNAVEEQQAAPNGATHNNENNNNVAATTKNTTSVPTEPQAHPELLLKSAHDFDLDLTVPKTLPEVSKASAALAGPFVTERPKGALSVTDYKMRRGLI